MKIRDQRYRTLKDLTVRRVFKDNKVPGTRDPGGDKGARSPSPGVSGEGQESRERARLSCEQPGACLDQGGLSRKNFSKRKRK